MTNLSEQNNSITMNSNHVDNSMHSCQKPNVDVEAVKRVQRDIERISYLNGIIECLGQIHDGGTND